MTEPKLPEGFILGVSTAAAQIEGVPDADGRGESIWDRFAQQPGAIERGERPGAACDHYRRWREDLDLIAGAGLDAYRFSVAWPRVLPEGTGTPNEAGLAFYDRLVDGCLERGIEPWVCLYHWDLPQALEDRGGWPSEDAPGWFVGYAEAVARRLGDRVKRWATFNEPSNPSVLGYGIGMHAPGRSDLQDAGLAIRSMNRAHLDGADALRANVPDAQVGVILSLNSFQAATDAEEDVQAARFADLTNHRSFTGPLLEGVYPSELAAMFPRLADESEMVKHAPATLDWLGVNYYGSFFIGADPDGGPPIVQRRDGTTAVGWEPDPAGLTRWLSSLSEGTFDGPIYVTENGYPIDDERPVGGKVRDDARIDYMRAHLEAILAARASGADVRGYFAWTLIDNWEWTFGWRPRFGLVYLDPATQARTPKASYDWYASLARTRSG